MISSILVSNITNITELKKNPVIVADTDVTCILNNGKPCFYTVSPKKMESICHLSNLIGENKEDFLESIFGEMTKRDLEFLEDCGKVDSDAFKRIVVSIAVNFLEIDGVEDIIRILEN